MTEIYLIISGVTGTLIMTLLMYFTGWIFGKKMDIIGFLGSAVYNNSTSKFIQTFTGIILNFMIGIIYAFAYLWLWSKGIGKPDFINSMIFGAITGLVALAVWNVVISITSNKSGIPVTYFNIALFITHCVFTIIVFYSYLFLARYPLPLY